MKTRNHPMKKLRRRARAWARMWGHPLAKYVGGDHAHDTKYRLGRDVWDRILADVNPLTLEPRRVNDT